MAIVTLAEVKSYLNISGTSHDAELEGFIAAAVAGIGKRVGPLEPTVVETVVSGPSVTLPVYPVLSLTTVTASSGVDIPLAGLTSDLAAGVISGFGSGTYTVTYSAGRNPCPPDLVLAAKELVRHLWMTQRGPTGRPGSPQSDAASNTIPGAAFIFPFRVEQLLAPYAQFGFA